MKRERFITFLEDNVLSMFTGSEIIGEEESGPRDACVAHGSGGTLLVKFSRSDTTRFVIKRVQPFKSFEVQLVRSILEEMKGIFKANLSNEFIKGLEAQVTQNAICKALTKSASATLNNILNLVSSWGMRTYEGGKPQFGFLITSKKCPRESNNNMKITQILKKDYSALLSDGKNTCLVVSADGYLLSYESFSKTAKETILAPYEHLDIANLCVGAKVGVCLIEEGDILVFKDKQLLFAKRNGSWVCFSHEEIIGKLAERSDEVEEVRKAIYLSALDTSFARTGGCIVHVNNKDRFNILKHIDIADLLFKDCYDYKQQEAINHSFFTSPDEASKEIPPFETFLHEDKCAKSAALIKIINGRKFHEVNRKLRQELIGIDGATIIDYEGNILAVGAIIKIEAGSVGGGRLAAAKTLSNYGISMKISADGRIEGFRMDRNKLRVKPIFVIG
ncbi:MAG: hypothetical protein IKC11_00840 [Clostridia bacterium]|nr:hypothetical protein [Clostridia bacterium]